MLIGGARAFLLAESALRVVQWHRTGKTTFLPPFEHHQTYLGIRPEPSRSEVFAFPDVVTCSGTAYPSGRVTINRMGLRGREITADKPPGTFRILCVGGSTTFGFQLDDRWTYPALLEERLRQLTGANRVEVINAGYPLRNSLQNYRELEGRLMKLEPDLVLLMEGINDVIALTKPGLTDWGPADSGELHPLPLSPPLYPGRELPGLLLAECAERLLPVWDPGEGVPRMPVVSLDTQAPFPDTIFSIFRDNLLAQIAAVRSRGAQVWILTQVVVPCPGVRPGASPTARRSMGENLHPHELILLREVPRLNQVLRSLAADESIPLIDLDIECARDPEFFYDCHHFTPPGNEELASILARHILTTMPEVASDQR